MSAIPALTEDEAYLAAILDDPSGVELAELMWIDEEQEDGCYRLWHFQWPLYRNERTFQIDFMGRSLGKALALDTPIATPTGWATMGGLRVGDEVFDDQGRPTRVTRAYEVRTDRSCFEVEFDDGETIVADGEHLWSTWTKADRKAVARGYERQPEPRTTGEIARTLRVGGEHNHRVVNAGPLQLPDGNLALDPYYLGVWLGDGTTRNAHITSVDAEVIDELRRRGFVVTKLASRYVWAVTWPGIDKHTWKTGSVSTALRRLGVLGNKHIPAAYLRASESQRRDLLAGLMDSDGHIRPDDSYAEITQKDERIALGIMELLWSLGEKPRITKRPMMLRGVDVGVCYRVTWRPLAQPALLARKAASWRPVTRRTRVAERRIVAVRAVPTTPVRCIEVAAESHLFLAGRAMIPTHNSAGIQMRAFAFPFNYPGQEMLITAPELNHLRPITDKVEYQILSHRLTREMLPRQRGNGINHQPQFQVHFANNSRIVSRIPQPTGRGVKGCLAPGTLILTKRGQVPIEDVVVGDEVMTHLGWWRPVLQTVRATDVDGYRISGGGLRAFEVSANHRLYTRYDRSGGRGRRDLTRGDWTITEAPLGDPDLTHHYLGSPREFSPLPIPARLADPAMAWVAGRYLADGHLTYAEKAGTRTSGRVHIIAPEPKRQAVLDGMTAAGLRPTARRRPNGTWDVECSDTDLADLLERELGRHAGSKRCPSWALGAAEDVRAALLEGYLAGNGHWDASRERWTVGTASKALAVGVRLLGQTLGWSCSLTWVDPKVTAIAGRVLLSAPQRSFRVLLSRRGTAMPGAAPIPANWSKIRSVAPTYLPVAYDLVVAHDHSFIADGLIQHNQHPLVIEADEMQDYPENGWIELIETMKHYVPGARWRCHGVSNGLRDRYYRYTMGEDSDIPFYVHRYMAMHRPSWNGEERRAKIAIYGGTEDNIDYRRNIYGEHGDATNPLFVLHRLMGCVRMNESPWATQYNEDIYAQIKISDELLSRSGAAIEQFIQLPGSHLDDRYSSFWGGMDVGFTRDPSEIVVFGECPHPKDKGESLLRLLARVHLMRISATNQAEAVKHIIEFYGQRLRTFALDKTGNGLPLWQELDPEAVGTAVHLRRVPQHISARIRGYNFSSKVAVEFDDRPLKGRERPEDAVIEKNIVDFASDELRKLVDSGRLELPFDRELLTEWQGQEIQYVRDEGLAAGFKRRRYGGGSFHTLDASKMMIAGRNLAAIEAAIGMQKKKTPRLDRFAF